MPAKKAKISIRPFKNEDIPALYSIYTMQGVQESILSLPSDRLEKSIEFFSKLGKDDHVFVAEGGLSVPLYLIGELPRLILSVTRTHPIR